MTSIELNRIFYQQVAGVHGMIEDAKALRRAIMFSMLGLFSVISLSYFTQVDYIFIWLLIVPFISAGIMLHALQQTIPSYRALKADIIQAQIKLWQTDEWHKERREAKTRDLTQYWFPLNEESAE